MEIHYTKDSQTIKVSDLPDFCLDAILDCGQTFRWNRDHDGWWCGVLKDRVIRIRQREENLEITGCDRAFFENTVRPYFDLDTDYGCYKAILCSDSAASAACTFTPGMRLLRQDPFESLCCFILSQNNNIARIKKIVDLLCRHFGQKIEEDAYAFPLPQHLAGLTPEDLAPIRCGFRAPYLLDAANKVSSGEIDLDAVALLPMEDARKVLCSIRGVGLKVADCVLLYGMHRIEAFPLDVWMKRVMDRFYPNGLPAAVMECPGIAQQYLFHYVRCCPWVVKEE